MMSRKDIYTVSDVSFVILSGAAQFLFSFMRMRANLKLSQQGLLLVGVPSALMLVFLLAMLVLFLRLEDEARATERSKTIISKANALVKQYYDAASQLILYKYTRSDKTRQQFDNQLAATQNSFAEIKMLLASDRQELAMASDLQTVAEHGMALMRRYEQYLGGAENLNMLQVAALYRQFDAAGALFTEKLQRLTDKETARHRINSAAEEAGRNAMKLAILAGAATSITMGTLLSLFFSRNTGARLQSLVDNTLRLSRSEQLLPPLDGDDEIARLDRFFHKMANDLAQAMRKERAILDNAVDVICSLSVGGVFAAANPATLTVWGFNPEELIGQHFKQIILPADISCFEEALQKTRQQKFVEVECRVLSKEGKELCMSWSIRWSDTEQSYFCVAHDVSDRKEVERLKQEFVAMVSHELRTPLTSLQATLSLLSAGSYGQLSTTGLKRVSGAESSIGRLVLLINDLLDMEKMEAGKLSMTAEECDLQHIISRSVDAVQGFAEQQGVRLCADKIPSIKVLVDPDRLLQVVVNLLSNAIKFSDDGGLVEIQVQSQGDAVELAVIDHGAGIPTGAEQLIFEKYQQAQSTDGKKRRGTGLGLPICKAIVEMHGGSIGVRTTAGGGSTFWVRLPVPEHAQVKD